MAIFIKFIISQNYNVFIEGLQTYDCDSNYRRTVFLLIILCILINLLSLFHHISPLQPLLFPLSSSTSHNPSLYRPSFFRSEASSLIRLCNDDELEYQSISSLQQYLKMDFNEQITILQENIRMSSGKRQPKLKFVSSDKWRAIMLRAVQRMKTKKIYDSNLLFDLVLIVQSIKDAKFVEAILNLQPFRPNFLLRKRQGSQKKQKEHIDNIEEYDSHHPRTKLASISNFQYRNSIIKLKRSVNQKINDGFSEMKEKHKKSVLEELLCYVTEEETLTRQFQGKSHPFRKIIEQYLFLVENKYKNLIEHQQSIKIQEIQEILIVDVKLLQEFIIKSSEPYITIFKTENQEEKIEFQLKMVAFLKQYIEKHEKINMVIRKIMRMASRKTGIVRKLIKDVPDFVEVNNFDIKDIYRIEGCYLHSMNALMEFAECTNSKLSLKKLKEFRSCLSKDVDDFYEGKQGAPQNRQICAQTQIQILKFIIAKLKSFLPEIFAQLKFLQVVYGQSDMSFKYDDSSYMYAQVSVALEALEMDFS